MPSVLAIISKAVFKALPVWRVDEHVAGLDSYKSGNAVFSRLTKDDAVFLVTVRDDEALWLVAVLDKPVYARGMVKGTVNTTPLTDISKLLPRFALESGDGIKARKGKLGMSLQTPRVLAATDVALLRKTLPKGGKADADDRMSMNAEVARSRKRQSKAKKKAQSAAELEASGGVPNHGGKPSPAARKLIEQVYAAPDDQGLRAVVGDALLEEHHVWGELISLQLANKQPTRVKEIVYKHAPDMVGPIVHLGVRAHLVFEDGFLASCTTSKKLAWGGVGRKQWTQAASAREWATVHTVVLHPMVVPHWWITAWIGNKSLARLRLLQIGSSMLRRDSATAPWVIEAPGRKVYGHGHLATFLKALPPAELARIPTPSSPAVRELIEKVKNPPPARPKKAKKAKKAKKRKR